MHFFRDCGVSAVLESSGITYHCCPIKHTNPVNLLRKLFSCLKHNAIVNFLCKSIGYTLCLTICMGQQCVGIDRTCKLLTEGGWRESMVGTISLYAREEQRLHTIQMGATPEYGKKKFYGRFDQELSKVKERYPKASYVAIADGAKDNGSYLSSRIDRQWVDFWHAVGYLGKVADALFSGKRQRVERKEWLDQACHRLKSQPGSATRLYNEIKGHLESRSFKKTDKEHLLASVTYFKNNQSKITAVPQNS